MDSGFDMHMAIPSRTAPADSAAAVAEHGFALGLSHVVAILAVVLAASALLG